MKKPNNYNSVQRTNDNFEMLPSGGYVCQITEVSDDPNKEMLTINYDIFEGEYKGYFKQGFEALGFWTGRMYIKYDDDHASGIKGFVEDIEASNTGFTFDWNNPKCLLKRGIGLLLQQEEYLKKDGSVGIRINAFPKTKTCKQIRSGDFKVPTLRTLKNGSGSSNQQTQTKPTTDFNIMEDDIQF